LNRRVVVTGASGAIGAATVAALREAGDWVVGIDRTPSADVIGADLRDGAQVRAAVAASIERLGGLDVLVNNAGIGDAHDAGEAPDASAEAIVDVNLFGAWRVTAAALPALLESRGRVINVASGLALVNVPFAGAYAASKRALAAWSDTLRLEYGGTISVTTVYPGYIRTPIHDAPAARGVSLDDLVPAEPIDGTVHAIVRSCGGRPRRDRATSRQGAVALAIARRAPGLVDRLIALRARRAVRHGAIGRAPLAARAREHMAG
jgi:NAD(P)-dependent dehydrogenase (short-subunit alcohol dehydrogenase family)